MISIVIPVFNEERYLAECLNSLTLWHRWMMTLLNWLKRWYRGWGGEIGGDMGTYFTNYEKSEYEIILVDNGSTDRTLNRKLQIANLPINKKSHKEGVKQ